MHMVPRAHGFLLAITTVLLLAFSSGPASAQADSTSTSPAYTSTSDLSDVRLFRSWFEDAVFTPGVDLEPIYQWADYDGASTWFGGARVSMWVSERMEAGGQIGWAGASPDEGDGDSGFGDVDLYARYRLPVDFGGTIAAGSLVRLPTGNSTSGQDNTIVRIFGALRQDLGGAFTFTANLAFEYLELFGDDGNGIAVGFGSLIPINDDLTTIFELNLRTAFDYAMVTGGVDYELPPGGHLRAAIGVGLDDQAPDFDFQLALSLPVF